jgi:HPt (histidine-containing phosphotransfer) domain-containing protein
MAPARSLCRFGPGKDFPPRLRRLPARGASSDSALSDEGTDRLLPSPRERGATQESPFIPEKRMSVPEFKGSTPGAQQEVLDASVIQSLRELGGEEDPGLLLELIDLYLCDAPQRMGEIEQGLAQGDWKLLERAAHTLKSASANIGALGLSAICKELEANARLRDAQLCSNLQRSSAECLARVESALRRLRS